MSHKIGEGLPSLNILPTVAQCFGSSEGCSLLRTRGSSPNCRRCWRCRQAWEETWLGWPRWWWSRAWHGLTTRHGYPQHTTEQQHPETPEPTRHMCTYVQDMHTYVQGMRTR